MAIGVGVSVASDKGNNSANTVYFYDPEDGKGCIKCGCVFAPSEKNAQKALRNGARVVEATCPGCRRISEWSLKKELPDWGVVVSGRSFRTKLNVDFLNP